MSSQDDLELGKMAVARGLLQPTDLASCLQIKEKSKGKTLADILMSRGYLSDAKIAEIKKELGTEKKQFGRYQIEQEIGRGGMGRVYKALDTQLDRVVALKVLLSEDRQENVERFLREAKATAELHHPNIISLHDIGRDEGQNYFTMDYIEGSSLQDYKKEHNLSFEQIANITIKVAQALHYAHGKGIIHRDIKPANIMIAAQEKPIVMDFGLAKVADASKNLSLSGVLLGTMYYMSPEQTAGRSRSIDARSDVYALGVVLYELITEQLPFTGETVAQVIANIVRKTPAFPSEINPKTPTHLEAICLKAMAKDKKNRYTSAQALAQDLTCFLKGKPITAKVPNPLQRLIRKARQNHFLVIAIAATILFLIIAAMLYSHREIHAKILAFEVRCVDPDKKMQTSFKSKDEIQLEIFRQIESNGSPLEHLTIYGSDIEILHHKYTEFTSSRTVYQPIVISNLMQNKFKVRIQIKIAGAIQEKIVEFTTSYPEKTLSKDLQDILKNKESLSTFAAKKRLSKKEQKQMDVAFSHVLKKMYSKDKTISTLALQALNEQMAVAIKLLKTRMGNKTAKLLASGLKSKNPILKEKSIRFLGHMAKKAYTVVSSLYALLKDKNPHMRLLTINALAKIIPGSKTNRKTRQSVIRSLTSIAYSDAQLTMNIAAIKTLHLITGGK